MKYVSGGYDLRIVIESLKPDPRQANQRLVPENWHMESADPSVWLRPDAVDQLVAEDTNSYPLGLRNTLQDILSALRNRGIPIADLSPISLTIDEARSKTFYRLFGDEYFRSALTDEDLVSKGWRFLGFDVVELNGLISGLKGIGYQEPMWAQMRAQFGPALNDVGLFGDERQASQFARVRGNQIPTHAPFDVVGLFVHHPIER
jgi:hypothetical protein